MVTFGIAEIQREFSRTVFFSFFYLQILHKYIKRCDTAMLFINEFYQKNQKTIVMHFYVTYELIISKRALLVLIFDMRSLW